MSRALVYIAVGWLLIASVAGLGRYLGLTIMLPATTVAVIVHMTFSTGRSIHGELGGEGLLHRPALAADLALALALGYLEDIHQGMLTGTLCLAYGLVFLALRWASHRVAADSLSGRAVVILVATALVDLTTWAVLITNADALGLRPDALLGSVRVLHWHALATLLAAPAVWIVLDTSFRLERRVSSLLQRPGAPIGGGRGGGAPGAHARIREPGR